MEMICESENHKNYLNESNVINYSDQLIKEKCEELFLPGQTEIDKVKIAFEFVRDKIAHSWDIQNRRVTCMASDVLKYKEGICYAKSNLLAALLRTEGIPTGFCYQRLVLFDTSEKRYCIHALNAVYIQAIDKWIRLDARGNKDNINAQFSIDTEQLAFRPDVNLDEKDYPIIYARPHPKTMAVLNEHTDAIEMYTYYLPEYL